MKKARKLLSLLLLMVFVIPFVPSHVASVSGVEGMSVVVAINSGEVYIPGDSFEMRLNVDAGELFDYAGHTLNVIFDKPDQIGMTAEYDGASGEYVVKGNFGVNLPLLGVGTYNVVGVEIVGSDNSKHALGLANEAGFSIIVPQVDITADRIFCDVEVGIINLNVNLMAGYHGITDVTLKYRHEDGTLYSISDENLQDWLYGFSVELTGLREGKYVVAEVQLSKGEDLKFSFYPGTDKGFGRIKDSAPGLEAGDLPAEKSPTVSNVESFLAAGAVDGVATWWAGLALELDRGTYVDIKYIDALWAVSGMTESYGEEILRVRLEEDETGRFVGDTQLHRFYKEGKYELLDLELRNSDGEMAYWIARKEGSSTGEELLQYLSGGDITLEAENLVGFDPKKYELKVTPVEDVFIDGEDLKFNFSMNIPDGVIFPFKYAFVEVFGTDRNDPEFIRVEWDSVNRVFNVKDFKNKHAMDYYGFEIYFSNNPNEVISGNWVKDAISVPFLPNLRFTVKAVEDVDIEDLFNKGEEVYEAIEEAIAKLDPTVPEEKAKIEELEKVLRDIDTDKKAVEPEVEKEAPKFVFETANLRALRIEEARDPNVKNISVEVDFEVKTPEEIKELVGEGTAIIGLYDMSLIKRVIKNDDSETVGTIANEDILEKITLRLPISRELSERDLKVVYVDAAGKITELETRLVAIGEEGKEDFYLQFETDHFSMYGILDVTEPEAPVDPEEPEEPVVEPEEPVVEPEEPVEGPKDPEVKPETPKEEEKVEDKEEDTLPETGSGAVWMYSMSGIGLVGAGVFGLRKKEDEE